MLSWVPYTRKRQHSNLQSEVNSESFQSEWVTSGVTARWFIAWLVRGVLTSPRFPSLAWGPPALRIEIDYSVVSVFSRKDNLFKMVIARGRVHVCVCVPSSSFSNPSVVLSTSQHILQPFRSFTYVTAQSPTLISLLICHRLFTYVTWRAAHELYGWEDCKTVNCP